MNAKRASATNGAKLEATASRTFPNAGGTKVAKKAIDANGANNASETHGASLTSRETRIHVKIQGRHNCE